MWDGIQSNSTLFIVKTSIITDDVLRELSTQHDYNNNISIWVNKSLSINMHQYTPINNTFQI